MMANYVTRAEHVEDDQGRTKYQTLGDTLGQRSGGRGADVHDDKILPVRQQRAVWGMLKKDLRRESWMVWLMVSRAAVRSRRMRTLRS